MTVRIAESEGDMRSTIVPGEVVQLSHLVRRITQNNPGLMTGPGTNTYLIGRQSLFILDPGENTEEHYQAILDAAATTEVQAVAPSHTHPDHWPLAPRLAKALDTITIGFIPHNGYKPDRTIADGEVLKGEDWTLEALHTPGHISDHLSYFFREERILFSGDHVMGWSTSVISRPDGNLNDYINSLERLRNLEMKAIYPAHGEIIIDGKARVEELIAHRQMRTKQILEAIQSGLETVPAMVKSIYADVDPKLHPAARQSVLAHLDALLESGQVTQDSNRYRLS